MRQAASEHDIGEWHTAARTTVDTATLKVRCEERAAIAQYDGERDRASAEAMAWHEVAAIWHRQHGTPSQASLCARCAKPLSGAADILILPHGERCHASEGWACLLAYGRRWKAQAVVALAALEIPTPPDEATKS